MFAHRERLGDVEIVFTDRLGGVSTGERAELDLGAAETPDPDLVEQNRVLLAGALGVDRLAVMHQVHGRDVAVVGAEAAPVPTADALVTADRGVALMARAADCLPVLLADPRAGLVAAVHAGRVGLTAGVIEATVEQMRERGATELHAWLGPRACGSCYELPEQMADEVGDLVPGARSTTSWGTPAVDLGAGARQILSTQSVRITDVGGCTIADPTWFSHRRQGGAAGRHAAVVVLR